MEPEDRLDALLNAQGRGAGSHAGTRHDDELGPSLAAADRLATLRDAGPTPEFARDLHAQLLERADQRRATQPSIHTAPTSAPSLGTLVSRPLRHRLRTQVSHPPRLLWPALAAAILLALGVGTFTASANAGPQSPFYGLHRTMENAQVQFASSQAQRVQLHLQYADEALVALTTAAGNHDDAGYATALVTLRGESTAATQALGTLPDGSEHTALAAQLQDLQASAQQHLTAALAAVDWQNRVATTTALGSLGASVPHVTAATITQLQTQGSSDGSSAGQGEGQGDGHGSQGRSDQVTVNGSGFKQGARLIVNGHAVPQATDITVTNTQLVASCPPGLIESAHSAGVSNPDGTAAETTSITRVTSPDNGDNGGNGNNGGNGDNGNNKHSSATPTATPDHNKGRHP